MKAVRVFPLLVMIAFAASLGSVYANGYQVGLPILGTTGTPALASPSLFSGAITVLYADGTPVFLSTNQVTLSLCGNPCVSVDATLKQTAPGTYTYTFTPPTSVSGTVTIYVTAGSLADDNGKIFPSTNEQIGTYSSPSSSASQSPAAQAPIPGTPVQEQVKKAVDAQQATVASASPAWIVLVAVVALLATGLVLIAPRRH